MGFLEALKVLTMFNVAAIARNSIESVEIPKNIEICKRIEFEH